MEIRLREKCPPEGDFGNLASGRKRKPTGQNVGIFKNRGSGKGDQRRKGEKPGGKKD
jgi:hypothetical protein